MTLQTKLQLLEKIFDFYEDASREYISVCTAGCSLCCTHNVWLTTLEGFYIISSLRAHNKGDLLERIYPASRGKRLKPRITTNHLAYKCLNKIEPPGEDSDYKIIEPCPFLEDSRCLIYNVRPFGCRSFFSKVKCDEANEAVIEPSLLTLNNVFLQFIEHIDVKGLVGNIIDIFLFLQCKDNMDRYCEMEKIEPSHDLLTTRPTPGFLIPPEHQAKTTAVVNELRDILKSSCLGLLTSQIPA